MILLLVCCVWIVTSNDATRDSMIDKIPENITFSYELVKKIGEGANGETWLLRDRVKKTQAILKFLKFLSAEDLKTVELFQREA